MVVIAILIAGCSLFSSTEGEDKVLACGGEGGTGGEGEGSSFTGAGEIAGVALLVSTRGDCDCGEVDRGGGVVALLGVIDAGSKGGVGGGGGGGEFDGDNDCGEANKLGGEGDNEDGECGGDTDSFFSANALQWLKTTVHIK